MAARPTVLCLRCGECEGEQGFVQLARSGALEQVCQRCFLIAEVDALTRSLPPADGTRELVEEGLRTLYEVVRDRQLELAEQNLRDAAKGRSKGKGKGQGRCRSKGQG